MTIAGQLRTHKYALTVNELAEVLRLDEGTLRRHVRQGHVPYFRIGMTIRFDPQLVADCLERNMLLPVAMRFKKVG